MPVLLKGLKYRNSWVSRLGALQGCMRYLKIAVSDAWLFGATGHAFVLNISDDGCPSGPTAWNCGMITNLAHNAGIAVEVVNAFKHEADFELKQKIAWENTKRAIDQGYPCYGWELGIPEFYVIAGYDENGYYYKGFGTPTFLFHADKELSRELEDGRMGTALRVKFADHGIALTDEVQIWKNPMGAWTIRGAGMEDEYTAFVNPDGLLEVHDDYVRPSVGFKPWQELGQSDNGFLHAGWVEPGEASDDLTTVKEALEFAVEFSRSPAKWVFPRYKAGSEGYDNWLKALLAEQKGDPIGLAYNGEVWAECRGHAERFLVEAGDRIGGAAGRLLYDAAEPYGETARHLRRYAELLPFHGRTHEMLREPDRITEAEEALRGAKDAEERGLQALEKVIRAFI